MAVFETSELALDLTYQTHYYKTSYAELKKAYLEALEGLKHNIVSDNDDYCEIYSEIPHFIVIAKIIEQNPIETSIDFYINSETMFGKEKHALKFINYIYKKLEEKFEFKGVARHKEN